MITAPQYLIPPAPSGQLPGASARVGGVSPRGSGHATIVTLTIELIAVGLMAALAESGPKMGKAMVALMGGFMLMWFIVNAPYFASIVNKMQRYA